MSEPRDEEILNRAYKIWEQHGNLKAEKMSSGTWLNRNCATKINPRRCEHLIISEVTGY
jgi:hypothetical protein